MRQQILLHTRTFTISQPLVIDATPMDDYYRKDLIHQVPSPVTEALEVPSTYKCSHCKAQVKTIYQSKLCKPCLLAEFKPLRPIIDMTRQLTITRYDYNKQVPSPFGRGANTEKSDTNKNCGERV